MLVNSQRTDQQETNKLQDKTDIAKSDSWGYYIISKGVGLAVATPTIVTSVLGTGVLMYSSVMTLATSATYCNHTGLGSFGCRYPLVQLASNFGVSIALGTLGIISGLSLGNSAEKLFKNYVSSNQDQNEPQKSTTKIISEHLFSKNVSSNQSLSTIIGGTIWIASSTLLADSTYTDFMACKYCEPYSYVLPFFLFASASLSLSHSTKKITETVLNKFFPANDINKL